MRRSGKSLWSYQILVALLGWSGAILTEPAGPVLTPDRITLWLYGAGVALVLLVAVWTWR